VNVFIVSIKFLGWIVTIWVRLVRLIWEEMRSKILKGAQLLK